MICIVHAMSVLHSPFDQLSVVLPLTAVCPSTTPATPATTVRELRSLLVAALAPESSHLFR